MASQTINFITWNINGLKQNRNEKFEKLKNADVVFLQETHIGPKGQHTDLVDLKRDFHVFYTKYSSDSKGTAILVKKTPGFKEISAETDDCGTYVVLKCELEGQPYTLVSVYIHKNDDKTLNKLSRYLQSMATGLLVIGGDFNTVLNPFIDKDNSKGFTDNSTHRKLYSCAEMFMSSLQLVDVWRRKNPVNQSYTFHRNGSASRLDYFFIPDECVWRVKGCEIKDLEMHDHCPVYLEINKEPIMLQSPVTQSDARLNTKIADLGPSLDEESLHALSEADIVSAIQCLQVSDTPRPDSIPVSFYKDNILKVIPYVKMLYDRICRGTFNCSEHFNETVRSTHDHSQHFFNVDYLIIVTILAKRLDDLLSQPKGGVPKDSATLMITPKTIWTKISLSCIEEIKEQTQSNPKLYQDFHILKNLLRDAPDTEDKLLNQGCPLTPVLKKLALKCFASSSSCKRILVFKENMILFIQPNNDKAVIADVKKRLNKKYEYKDLAIVNEARNEEEQSEAVEADGGEQGQLRIPLKTSDDVRRLSDFLAEDRCSKDLVECLSQPVNLDLNYVVQKVMNRLFAKDSLSNFTWEKRRGQKEPFSKLRIFHKIIDAVQNILPKQSIDSIKQEIKNEFINYTK